MRAFIALFSAPGPPQNRLAAYIDGLAQDVGACIRIGRFPAYTAVFASLAAAQMKAASGSEVMIVTQGGQFQLLRDGWLNFIKGAVGWGRLDERQEAWRKRCVFGRARPCRC